MSSQFSHCLNTNYAPSDDDVELLKDLVNERQAILDGIDKEIAALTESRTAQKKFIDEHSALLAPVRRLPADILSSIFLACLDNSQGVRSWPVMSDKHPAVVLSHVSQQWRELALSTPLLWSIIDIKAPPFPYLRRASNYMSNPDASDEAIELYRSEIADWKNDAERVMEIAATWISRSRHCPLSLKFTAQDVADMDEDGNPPQMLVEYLARLVDVVCATSPRWREARFALQIYTPTNRRWQDADTPFLRIPQIKPKDLPLLETLHLYINHHILWSAPPELTVDSYADGQEEPLVHFDMLAAPSLRSLGMTPSFYLKVQSQDVSANWGTLTDLYLGEATNVIDHSLFNAAEALALLKLCPSLVTCFLTFQNHPYTGPHTLDNAEIPNARNQILLPFLKSMSIRGFLTPNGFASSLYLPSLRVLSIVASSARSQNEDASGLTDWIRNCGEQLVEVTLNYATLTASALHYVLQHIPNVVRLTMLGSSSSTSGMYPPSPMQWGDDGQIPIKALLNDAVMEKLTPRLTGGGDATCLCPQLEEFNCILSEYEVEFSTRAFLDFIVARRQVEGQAGAIERLKRVSVKFGIRHRINIGKKLRERGVDLGDFSLRVGYHPSPPFLPAPRPFSFESEFDFQDEDLGP